MRVDVVFDTVCPWCYIGTRRLQRALRARPFLDPVIHWQPFLLNPELPPEGIDRATFLERKFGHPLRVQRALDAVTQAGAAEGIDFQFDLMERMPNSLPSHRLVKLASEDGLHWEVLEAIYRGLFTEGLDIGDPAVLAMLAGECGMDAGLVAEHLAEPSGESDIQRGNLRAHRMGVTSVPCFVFAQRYAVAGAQEPDVLLRLIDLARENLPEPVAS